MKRYLFLILILVFLAGCSVKSEKDLKNYANRNYGRAKLLRTVESENRRTCYFQDKTFGFEYYVTSSLDAIRIDGSYFGSVENTTSDYKQVYLTYITEKINASEQLSGASTGYFSCVVSPAAADNYFVLMIDDTAPDFEQKIGALASLVKKYDKKKLNRHNMKIVNAQEESIGEYDFTEERYLNPQEVVADYYMDRIRDYTGGKPKYLYHENRPYEQVPGIQSYTKVNLLGGKDFEQEGVDLFYFELHGKTYFVTDYLVYEESYPEYADMLFYNSCTGKARPQSYR